MSFDPKKFLVLLAMIAALLVAGCGGDDEDDGGDSGSGEALSEEDYATEIQGILTTFGEESVALGTELAGSTSAEDLGAGVDSLQEVTQTAVDDLNAITPPEAAAEAHETLTGGARGLSRGHRDAGERPRRRKPRGDPGGRARLPGVGDRGPVRPG